jgi:corrinoid protein of di/trimethylamine methyltransferase
VSTTEILDALQNDVVRMDFNRIVQDAQRAMDAGIDPLQAIEAGMAVGMEVVGDKFERGEYFLSELMVAGAVMKEGLAVITPHLAGAWSHRLGTVVVATVEGDYHDIGKNIVSTLLLARGFEVIDLGTDVPTATIVDAVRQRAPHILGLSALLTMTMPKMGEVIAALTTAGLRGRVKVIVGGTPVTSDFAQAIGADHRAADAVEGVAKCVDWMTPSRRR